MVVVRVTLKSPPVAREHTMTKRQGRTELIELLERDEDFLQAALQALLQAALEAEMSETIRSLTRSNISAQRRQRSRRNWFRAGILASTWARELSRRPGPGSPIGSLRKDDPDRRAKRRGSAGPQQRVGALAARERCLPTSHPWPIKLRQCSEAARYRPSSNRVRPGWPRCVLRAPEPDPRLS